MAVQRKIFRIEEARHGGVRPDLSAQDAEAALRHQELMTEVRALRSMLEPRKSNREVMEASRAQIAEVQTYKAELELIHAALKGAREVMASSEARVPRPADISRASRELEAIVGGTEQATQQVLQAAEDIDQTANTLLASLKGTYERGLANDIRDRVVQVFEACNFQDLTGQRVGKVVEILAFLEEHVGRLTEIWSKVEQFKPVVFDEPAQDDRKFLNGPKLEGESGHSSQRDIDAMFG